MDSKQKAQARVEQIQAFKTELEQLQSDHVLVLTSEQLQDVEEHHSGIITSLANSFDVDINTSDKQLGLGIKIAALFGALGLAASIFFLFYQYWGLFGPEIQSLVLVLSPVVTLLLSWFLLQKDASGYYAKIAGFVSLVCLVLNLSMLGQIHNLTPSPNAFLVWSIFALGLTYLTRSRLLLVFAIIFFAGFLSARIGTWFGIYWFSFGERPENFFIPAIMIFALGHIQQRHYENFAPVFRVSGALLLLIPILLLSHWAAGSYLTWDLDVIEGAYQLLGFALSAGLVAYGIRKLWNDAINTGTIMFTVFLYTKFFDWFWDWFPKYLFFMVIGLSSLLILMIFKRIRLSGKDNGHNGEAND